MNRPTLSLLATVTALAAVTGLASLGSGAEGTRAGESERVPVQQTTLTCPRPTSAETATTAYTAFTPVGTGDRQDGLEAAAALLPAPEYVLGDSGRDTDEDEDADDDADEDADADADEDEEADAADADAVVPLEEPGVPVAATTKEAGAPALIGTARGRLAPGWTVQQTTVTDSGAGRGMLGTACQTPGTEFWFAGASTLESRYDYVHLTNPDEAATVVDIALYGADGQLASDSGGEGVTVPGGTTVPVPVGAAGTLDADPEPNLAVHVMARTGRIGAQLEVVDEQLGADWLAPVTAPAGPVVLPGIPEDAETVRLIAFTPGEEDISLGVQLVGAGGTFTPAGSESLSLRPGAVSAMDLGDITQGEAGSLLLTPAEGSGTGPVVAALRVTRGEDEEQDLAFIAATAPVESRATAGGNTLKGTSLSLTAPDDTVEVKVTISAGSDGGAESSETYTVEGGTTLAVAPEPGDDVEGRYALTVERVSGGTLYASRMLSLKRDDIPMFTVQGLPDDGSTVAVPETGQDFSVLTNRPH
ncbi:DUF5719 family protein [Streptomyces sodiiphilus]|uniref:DUF5719 family protein n=1 Tax=Streptomyces sodiiphilus TaxID=226217 RepID=A0ABN2PJV4_9ACTN